MLWMSDHPPIPPFSDRCRGAGRRFGEHVDWLRYFEKVGHGHCGQKGRWIIHFRSEDAFQIFRSSAYCSWRVDLSEQLEDELRWSFGENSKWPPHHSDRFTSQTPMRVGAHHIPRSEIPDEPLQIQNEASEREDEDKEATMEHEVGEGSWPKRRRPVDRPSRDSRLSDIASWIQSLQLGQATQWEYMQKWREENQLWMARQESRLEACETQIEHLHAQGDAKWTEAQAFYKAYYARFAPPPE